MNNSGKISNPLSIVASYLRSGSTRFFFAALALCVAATVQSATAKCRKDNFRYVASTTSVNDHWRVVKGTKCSTHMTVDTRSSGKMGTDNVVVTKSPSHGTVTPDNSTGYPGFSYKARSNFTGAIIFRLPSTIMTALLTQRAR